MSITTNPMPRLTADRAPHVTSGYGPRTGGMYSFHYGVDMLYPRGSEPAGLPWTSSSGKWSVPDASIGRAVPALAAGDGVVVKSGWIGTGDRVRIDHGGGWETGYMHLRSRRVNVGDRVRAGQPIGAISYSPWCSGCPTAQPPPAKPPKVGLNHLHFEVYKDGQNVNPESVFGRHLSNLRLVNDPWSNKLLKLLIGIGGATFLGWAASRYL
jgi:murein DD-endopeptidase MepM/ murein hydrolase activator NlpD